MRDPKKQKWTEHSSPSEGTESTTLVPLQPQQRRWLLLKSCIISTKDARFMTIEIISFYLNSPLPRPEFEKIKLSDIPKEIIDEYKLWEKVTPNGFVYIMATKGMYSLPQAGLIANELLKTRLNKHGYQQSKLVPRQWKQDTRRSSSRWLWTTLGKNMSEQSTSNT